MTDAEHTEHTHDDTTQFDFDCPKCRKQRYGNAERTNVTDDSIATTMTTEAALSVQDSDAGPHHGHHTDSGADSGADGGAQSGSDGSAGSSGDSGASYDGGGSSYDSGSSSGGFDGGSGGADGGF